MYKNLGRIEGIRRSHLLWGIAGAFFIQFLGGALIPNLYTLLYFQSFAPSKSSGRYFHSVFFSVLIYGLVLCKALRWPVKKCLDHYAIAAMIMSSIGRIGCFFQGCCSGKPTALPWGVRFPDRPDVTVHPTQIYSFALEFLILVFLLWKNKHKTYDGQTFWTGVFWYSVYRFFIEFLRTNPLFLFGLTHAQVFSALSFALSVWVLLKHRPAKP
jgi:phosphatidylglycerol:prolipoprotein diacylglycerol transferase